MKFTVYEIQMEIDRIQAAQKIPDFMLVRVDFGYYLDSNGVFRDELSGMALIDSVSKTKRELLTELAKVIIQQSL